MEIAGAQIGPLGNDHHVRRVLSWWTEAISLFDVFLVQADFLVGSDHIDAVRCTHSLFLRVNPIERICQCDVVAITALITGFHQVIIFQGHWSTAMNDGCCDCFQHGAFVHEVCTMGWFRWVHWGKGAKWQERLCHFFTHNSTHWRFNELVLDCAPEWDFRIKKHEQMRWLVMTTLSRDF